MKKGRAGTTSILCGIIAFVFFLAGLIWMTEPLNEIRNSNFGIPPSNESLINSFPGKRGSLQKMVAMIAEDKDVSCVSGDEISCKKGTYMKYKGKWNRFSNDPNLNYSEQDIEEEYILVSSNLTYPRYREYLNLLEQADAIKVRRAEQGHIEFLVWSKTGSAEDRHQIQYVYCPRDHETDEYSKTNGRYEETWKDIRIEPNWSVEHMYSHYDRGNPNPNMPGWFTH